MRIRQINDRGKWKWEVIWEKSGSENEWDALKQKYEEMGLTLSSTNNPFNCNPEHEDNFTPVSYYKEEPDDLLLNKLTQNPLLTGIGVTDSINDPIIKSDGSGRHRFNIAVLRVVPRQSTENPEEKISEISGDGTVALDYFKYGSRKYNEELKKIYESLFDTPTDVEIVIRPRRMVL
jgi:hypothetical protein